MFIVISLFDGYVKSMEDLLLCLTPDLQVLKKNDSEARKYFSQDEINEMIDIVSNTKRTKDKIISDFVLTEDWYLKKEKKQNQEVFFNKGDWIKLYGILSNDERIHCIDPVISGFDSYKISGSGNLSDSNKINLFVFASPFINGKTSSGIDRLLKNKNVLNSLEEAHDNVLVSDSIFNTINRGSQNSEKLTIGFNKGKQASLKISERFRMGLEKSGINIIFMHLKTAQEIKNLSKDEFNMIGLKLFDRYDSTKVKESIERQLPDNFYIINWADIHPEIFDMLSLSKYVSWLIIFCIILAAASNLKSALNIIISEKKTQISTMRALGARRNGILSSFLMTGLCVGLVGGASGLGAGYFLSHQLGAYQLKAIVEFLQVPNFSFSYDPWLFLTILLMTVLICILFTWGPARRASKVNIISGLKK